jgi:diaminopimelate epimerase
MDISFHKMHGLGNDFVLLDRRHEPFALETWEIQSLGNRRTGVGFDQLLVIETSDIPGVDAKYRIFNQDGSVAEHCGNGIRCVAKFLKQRLPGEPAKIVVEIQGKTYSLAVSDSGNVRVDMGPPIFDPRQIPATFSERALKYPIETAGRQFEIGTVSMGNPHAVFIVENLDDFSVKAVGQAMQTHANFPKQVNAGFMQIVDSANVRLRVWERGAGETQACGTGACAAMVIGRLWGHLDEKVTVNLLGGQLSIEWRGGDQDSVWMTGQAAYVFEGKIAI